MFHLRPCEGSELKRGSNRREPSGDSEALSPSPSARSAVGQAPGGNSCRPSQNLLGLGACPGKRPSGCPLPTEHRRTVKAATAETRQGT